HTLLCPFFLCLFFFSSRRRHTRSKRDWSSDVCSSDLSLALVSTCDSSSSCVPASIPISRSRCTVYMRAILRRTDRRLALLASWPVADWNRRLNSSDLASRSFWFRFSWVMSRCSDAALVIPDHLTLV